MNIERPIYLQRLIDRRHNGMIKIITGLRRSGKSYLLFTLFCQYLKEQGIDDTQIIKLDLENIYNERYRNPLPLLDYISQRVTDTREYFILIDEIQLLDRFEEVLNTLLKNPQLDVYVTGSNARFLSKDVVTTFRGRGDELRIHPLSFSEYMSVKPDAPFLETHLNEYMLLGGLPQTVTMPTEQQKKGYLQQLFSNTYLIDIKERYDIRNDDDLEELIDVMASNIGSLTNPQKIANTFHSAKWSTITRDTVKTYLDYMQDAFLMERTVRYDIKGRKYIDTPAKYYFEDLGLRNVRLNLRKQLEVDFVCNRGQDRIYIQSAYALPSEEKTEQELRSLEQIKDSFQKVVIVGGMQPTFRNDDGILILNIFDFLLNRSGQNL